MPLGILLVIPTIKLFEYIDDALKLQYTLQKLVFYPTFRIGHTKYNIGQHKTFFRARKCSTIFKKVSIFIFCTSPRLLLKNIRRTLNRKLEKLNKLG